MVKLNWPLIAGLFIVLAQAQDEFERTMKICCKLGTDHAHRWPRIGCTTTDYSLLPKLNFSYQNVDECELSFRLCCVQEHRTKNCDIGKSMSRRNEQCTVHSTFNIPSSRPSASVSAGLLYREHESAVYDCCQACKLGLIAQEEGHSCGLSRSLGLNDPWHLTFQECCNDHRTRSLSASVSPSSGSPSASANDLERDSTPHRACQNGFVDGQEKCHCNKGYKLSQTGQNCEDIDECKEIFKACASWQECINMPGNYTCVNKPVPRSSSSSSPSSSNRSNCPPGMTRSDMRPSECIDIDECSQTPSPCNPTRERCVNIPGSFRCEPNTAVAAGSTDLAPSFDEEGKCPSGYRKVFSRCVDIDECSIGMHSCRPRFEDCINTQGSFECKPRIERLRECEPGYQKNSVSGSCEDIDECQDPTRCPDTHHCINVPGTFLCIRKNTCGTGYAYNASSDTCDDIDECQTTGNICGDVTMFRCVNTPGTYRCQRIACPVGQTLQRDGSCRSIQCPAGFEQRFGSCEDIDECSNPSNPCPPGHVCVNLVGSFQCRGICEPGLRYDMGSNQCIDIDECAEGSHKCRPGQACRNTYRSYSCACPPGQEAGPDGQCHDINECAKYGVDICPPHSICVDSIGKYDCICEKGFRQVSHLRDCVDIDECLETPWVCPSGRCVNMVGSYACLCPEGFTLAEDGKTCVDLDECAQINNETGKSIYCQGTCTNTNGSYDCQCSEGFKVHENRFCKDLNECEQESNPCGEKVCLNTIGSFKCYDQQCPEGYIRDIAHTNRCKRPLKSMVCTGEECIEVLKKPMAYSYSYQSLPSEPPIPTSGKLNLLTVRGPVNERSNVLFELRLVSVEAEEGVEKATRSDFHLVNTGYNEAAIALIKPLKGEQEIKLELDINMYIDSLPSGKSVAVLTLHIAKSKIL